MSTTSIPRTTTDRPRSATEIAAIQENPGFGRVFTDHMVTIAWTADARLARRALVPYGPLTLDPATIGPPLRPGDLRGPQGLPAGRRRRSRCSGRRPTPRGSQRSAAGWRCRSCPRTLFVDALRAARRRRTRPGCPPTAERACTCGRSCSRPRSGSACGRPASYLFLRHRLARRRLLPAAAAAGVACGCRGVHPRRARRHRGRPSAAATTPPRWSPRRRPRRRAATRWSGSTRWSTAGSRRWAA